MNKVCFNYENKIIGFNLENSKNYINLFDIDSVEKTCYRKTNVDVLDNIGRRVFIKQHKLTKKSMLISSLMENDYEDEDFDYIKKTESKLIPYNSKLNNESYNFAFDDILEIKKNQLIEKYNCNDCYLIEIFNDIFENNYSQNCVIGENFVRINSDSTLKTNKVILPPHKEILLYCESTNDFDIYINGEKCKTNEFIKNNEEEITIEFKCDLLVTIDSFAILIN